VRYQLVVPFVTLVEKSEITVPKRARAGQQFFGNFRLISAIRRIASMSYKPCGTLPYMTGWFDRGARHDTMTGLIR